MLFNSTEFLLFFPLVVFAYFLTPQRFRWILLLTASYYFYMCWKAEYIILIIVSTLIDYFAGIKMEQSTTQRQKRKFLLLSLSSNLGILFAFKYFNFFSASFTEMLQSFNIFYDMPVFDYLLPVGISFYTFQTLSYSIEVYRGKQKAEHNLGIFALYVSFFPQLVAGPIERSTTLMPQFYERFTFDARRVMSGLRLMIWGFFKKVMIADTLAPLVNKAFNHADTASPEALAIATYFFAFQIYCDFSGYSDIAIGVARVMGYNLMENFRRPYSAISISDFWARWHISLSTWFKDYLYIPLGGNRVVKWRWYFNLFIVFLISGLWHGANWTFVIWGALHGFYLVVAILSANFRDKVKSLIGLKKVPKLEHGLQVFTTFHLVLLGWIFFRANTVSDAFRIISSIGAALGRTLSTNIEAIQQYMPSQDLFFVTALIGLMFLIEFIRVTTVSWRENIYLKAAVLSFLCWAMLVWGSFSSQQFIYFQF